MWTVLQSGMRDDIHTAIKYKGYVKPTHILRSIQLQFWNWFVHRHNHLTPPTPDLVSILNQVLLQLYVLPHLPLSLYHLAYPKKQTNVPNDNASVPGLIATGSASNSSASGSHSSPGNVASTISGITGGSSQKPTPTGGRGAYISNLAKTPSIVALDRPGVKLRDMIGTTSPPKMSTGQEMCLSSFAGRLLVKLLAGRQPCFHVVAGGHPAHGRIYHPTHGGPHPVRAADPRSCHRRLTAWQGSTSWGT